MRQYSLFTDPAGLRLLPFAQADAAAGFVPLSALTPKPTAPTGIARMAAEAPMIDSRNDVEYFDLACRTLITRCDSSRVPFDYQINPYRGCEIACPYCFARYTHEFMELADARDFERKVFIKRGAREALLRDLRRLDLRGRSIAIGTATDPYQPAERRFRLTRSVLEVLAARSGLRFSITTKSDLVTRDTDLLARAARRNEVCVNVTITTRHSRLSRRLEPRAPRPDRRLVAVRTLSEAGVRVGIFLMPVLPYITDAPDDLDLLLRLAREAGAQFVAAQVLLLRDCSRKRFLPFLAEQFPELRPHYERLYGPRGHQALASYTTDKLAEIRRLKEKYGLVGERRSAWMGSNEQLALAGWEEAT